MKNKILPLFIILGFLSCCADTPGKRSNNDPLPSLTRTPAASARYSGKILQPSDGDTFTAGEEIEFEIRLDEDAGEVVSVNMTVDGKETEFTGSISGRLLWNSSGQPAGTRQIRFILGFEEGKLETLPLRVVLRSDIVPDRYGYRVVNSYPHDIRAFTQGLIFHDGHLYESTGQYGKSSLRMVELESGNLLRSLNLDREFFGEGLCLHDGKLYQLTWKSRVGFIYDPDSFAMLGRVYYQTEGWGLTSDGEHLFKSDGSHYIYVLDPQHFSETGRLEVFDNKGRVEGLNEMEYIDGTIYANVFGTDEIFMIDPGTGIVTGIIGLKGILDRRYHHPGLDVLNGIAYDHENGRLFVTGKNWPRLFEIELVPLQ